MKRAVLAATLAVFAVALACARREPVREAGAAADKPAVAADALHLTFTYGSEKEAWIRKVTADFNAAGHNSQDGHPIYVDAIPMGSGDCLDELLNDRRQADITSPASAVFIRLGNAQWRAKTGKDLVASTETLVLSPVVIAMWKPMAEALGWPAKRLGWKDLLALGQDGRGWAAHGHPEWGAFRFGHTSPESSNSGLISILAETYAATGKKSGLRAADVADANTAAFVAGIERSVVHYGSSTGFFGRKMFANGPQYLSAAVLYENMVIESYGQSPPTQFPVVAIYPSDGTFWSDHPIGIVNREWVTPVKQAAARTYIDYLLAKPQQEQALPFGFRPGSPEVAVGAPVDAAHGADPAQPQTTLEVPSVDVVDAAMALWHREKKHADITLVFDKSGSMAEQGKIQSAREAAAQLLNLLGDDDVFSYLPFSNSSAWAAEQVPVKTGRAAALGQISNTWTGGGTALYDAIDTAYRAQLARAQTDANRISAIVVLTDGADTDSRIELEALLKEIRYDNEHRTIRIFTVAYGEDAKADVLTRIADATEARFYKGDPRNIRAVLREISTFF